MFAVLSIVILGLALAWANGANEVAKGLISGKIVLIGKHFHACHVAIA